MIETMTEMDRTALADIHARMGSRYALPDFQSPLFIIKQVSKEAGAVRGAIAVKMIGEAYLLLEPTLTRYEKARTVALLSLSGIRAAREASLEDVSAWLPPEVESTFGSMLSDLKWSKSPWPCWSRRIE